MSYLVLDTNVLLLDANNLLSFPTEDIIVLPETVVDELDSKKTGFTEIAYQAREFGRLLSKAGRIDSVTTGAITSTKFLLDSHQIWIVSSTNYPDLPQFDVSLRNDRKIIHVASLIQSLFSDFPTIVVSNDVMFRIRAESLGLQSRDFKQVDHYKFEFTKRLEVSEEIFSELHHKPITQIDPDYKPENYNYLFTTSNSEQVKPACIINGSIQIIGKETEAELRRQDASPINVDQLLLARAIQEPATDLIICDSKAGSGKTICAVSNAMKLTKRNPDYNSILYIRTSIDDVSDEESVGFLSGNEEKFAVYLHPINDVVDTIVRDRHKDSKLKGREYEAMIEEHTQKIFKEYNIQAMTTLGMRGRTFSNCIAIIDEVQNFTPASLNKVLTRFGKNCKIILIGSLRQIDSKYITKYTSGLSVVLNDAAQDVQRPINLHVVPLPKVVRSKLTEYSESLFTKSH